MPPPAPTVPTTPQEPSYPLSESPATQTVTAVAGAAASTSVGGAADLQALGVASLISCADARFKAAGKAARRSLLPFGIGASESRYVFALLAVVGGLATVQLVAITVASAAGFKATLFDRAGAVHFPSWSLALLDAASQGLALEGARLVARDHDGDGGDIAMGAIALTVCTVHAAAAFHTIRLILPRRALYVQYSEAYWREPTALRPLIAQGQWSPPRLRNLLGAYFNAWRPEGVWMTYVAVARPLIIGIVANIDAPGKELCAVQFVFIGLVSLATGAASIILRPFRAPARGYATGLTGLVTGVVLMTPAIPGTQELIPALVLTSTALAVTTTLVGTAVNLHEKFRMKAVEPPIELPKGWSNTPEEIDALRERLLIMPEAAKQQPGETASRSDSEEDEVDAKPKDRTNNPLRLHW